MKPRTLTDTIESLSTQLPDTYAKDSIREFKTGGTRNTFIVGWGPQAQEKRIVKVDRETTESPRAQRYMSRGYNTKRELNIRMQIPNARRNKIIAPVDYGNIRMQGEDHFYVVEEFFEGQTLRETIQQHGQLPFKQVEKIFRHVLGGASHLENNGLCHRDLSLDNILTNEHESVITDLANAGAHNQAINKPLPTAGARAVMDPTILEQFAGRERAYDARAEVFALATNMYTALTGEQIIDLDPDTNTIRGVLSNQPLTKEDGLVDEQLYNQEIQLAQQHLKKVNHRGSDHYAKPIQEAVAWDRDQRPESIRSFTEKFQSASKPTIKERLSSTTAYRLVTAATISALLGIGAVGTAIHEFSSLENELEHKSTLQVEPFISDNGPEYDNQVLDLSAKAFNYSSPQDLKRNDKFLSAQPGDNIHLAPKLDWKPTQFDDEIYTPVFSGRVYIEGSTVDGSFRQFARRKTDSPPEIYRQLPEFTVPDTLQPGVYQMALEVIGPSQEDFSSIMGDFSKINFKPGAVINRELIPVVVGDVPMEERLHVARAQHELFNYQLQIQNLEDPLHSIPRDMEYTVTTADTSFTVQDESWSNLDTINMPYTGPGNQLVQVVGRLDDRVLFTHYRTISSGEERGLRRIRTGKPIPGMADSIRAYESRIGRGQ